MAFKNHWKTRVRYTRWRKRPILQVQIRIPIQDEYGDGDHYFCYWRDATLVDIFQMIECVNSIASADHSVAA